MLVLLSANHKNTPFETLESLSAVADERAGSVARAHESIRGAVIVSTCNRFEAYLDIHDEDGWTSPIPAVSATINRLAEESGSSARELRESLEFAHGSGVAHHLFSVASGLESVALGEDEIAGQVRRSIEASRACGTTTPELERLFRRATEASREVRATSNLSPAGRSLVQLALQLASSRIADWASARILLVGSGRFAAVSLAAMRELGAREVSLYSVSGRGRRFAESHDIPLIAHDRFDHHVGLADVILTCTTAEGFVLSAARIASSRAAATSESVPPAQLLIDLGLPRNIDPDAAGLTGVQLLDLETIRLHAPIDELSALAYARETVRAAATRYVSQSHSTDVSRGIVAVRGFVSTAVEDEVSRLAARGQLNADGERALRHLGGVLMHRLTVQGQQLAASGESERWVESVEHVFGVAVKTDRPSNDSLT